MSGSADGSGLPWLYPYLEDGPRLDKIVRRPVVSAALVGPSGNVSHGVYALVDSGCSHILAAPWLAPDIGVNPRASMRDVVLGIGGACVRTRFMDLQVRLLAPGGTDEDFIEWEAEVGFLDEWRPTFPMLMGQDGFFDKFTVTMSNFALLTAVERPEVFDERFGVPPAPQPSYVSARRPY